MDVFNPGKQLAEFYLSIETIHELRAISEAFGMDHSEFVELAVMVYINREKRGAQNEYSF